MPNVDLARQQQVAEAFLAAARKNDFDALLAVLDPDVVLRADRGAMPPGASRVVRGARTVAEHALTFWRIAGSVRPALVNGAAGIVAFAPDGAPFSVVGFTVRLGKIAEIDVLADPARLKRLKLAVSEN